MDYDLVTQWTLWFFGACFGALLLGAIVGKLASFEVGMTVGLLLLGGVSLSFVPRFWLEYRDLTRHPLRVRGVVVEVEHRPTNAAGDVTTPVAVVEYEAPGGEKRRVDSRAASGLEVGDEAVVIPQPSGAKVGQPEQMYGGSIAALLFGTFPFSAGIFFGVSAIAGWRESRASLAERRRAAERSAQPSRLTPIANAILFAGFVGPITWGSLDANASVLRAILLAFGLGSLGLWLHVFDGLRMRRDPRWTFGIAVIALNFSVWALALWSFGAAPGEGW